MEAVLLLIHVLWNFLHLVVALPEEADLLVVEVAVPLKILPAEIDSEIAVVVLDLETATVVADRWAFVVADPVLDFEIVAVVSVVAPVFVDLLVSVCFLHGFGGNHGLCTGHSTCQRPSSPLARSRATFSNIHRVCPQHTTHRSALLCCLWTTAASWLPVGILGPRTVGADHQLLSLLRRDTTLWILKCSSWTA